MRLKSLDARLAGIHKDADTEDYFLAHIEFTQEDLTLLLEVLNFAMEQSKDGTFIRELAKIYNFLDAYLWKGKDFVRAERGAAKR